MKREVEREINLQAFDLEIGDVELLWERMRSLFAPEANVRSELWLSLPSERLSFSTIDEFKNYKELRGQVRKFGLRMSHADNSVALSSGGLLSDTPTLKVAGPNDVWCAGALEAVARVTSSRRTWYYWIAPVPFSFIFYLLLALTFFEIGPLKQFDAQPWQFRAFILVTLIFFGFFGSLRTKLLPKATITLTRDLGFLRRYAGEIGLILGVIGIALALYMWIVPYHA